MKPGSALLPLVAAAVALSAAPASAAGNLLQSLLASGGGAGSLFGPAGTSLLGGGSPSVTYVMAPQSPGYGYAPPPPRLPPPPSVTRYLPPPPSIGAPPGPASAAYAPALPPPPPPAPVRDTRPLQSASAVIAATREVKECRHGQWSGENGQLVVGTACLGPDGWHLY